jgi:DNA-binding transcriptional LysR family regulator
MDKIQAMRIFTRVAELKSFHIAGVQLGLSAPVVSRSVSGLETHLRTKLLNRTTRRLSLSAAGIEYFESCKAILRLVEESESRIWALQSECIGPVHLAAPSAIAYSVLNDIIRRFRIRYPAVTFDVVTCDALPNLVDGGLDLAFTIERVATMETAVYRRLADVPLVAVCTPLYCSKHTTPRVPADLADHALLTSLPDKLLCFTDDRSNEEQRIVTSSIIRSPDLVFLHEAALNHLGVALLPEMVVRNDLNAGKLVRVLNDYTMTNGLHQLSLVFPSRAGLRRISKLFVDFVVEGYRDASDHAGASPYALRGGAPTGALA